MIAFCRYNEIQKQLSVKWRKMSSEDKRMWLDKSSEVKRQLSEYTSQLAAKGLLGSDMSAQKGEMKRVKKGIALPKGPR